MGQMGSVQLLVIGFGPDAEHEGQLLAELECLEAEGNVRVLDLLLVGRDAESGALRALNYQGDAVGGLLIALAGLTVDGTSGQPVLVQAQLEAVGTGRAGQGLEAIVSGVQPGEAVALLLLEHLWARDFKGALRDAGASTVTEMFLSVDDLVGIAADLESTVRVLDEQEREEQSVPSSH